MPTTAIAAKAALKTIAESSASLSSYKVTWAYPTKAAPKRWLMLGEVKWSDSSWATNKSRQESYKIAFTINVQITAGDGEAAERAAIDAATDFENAVKATPNLGVAGVTYTDFQHNRLFSFPTDEYFEGQLDGEIEIHARI